jgi:hypothetical protein
MSQVDVARGTMRTLRSCIPALALAALLIAAPADAATCKPIRDPYPGTRYEGVDLKRIRTTGVGCETGRRVVRLAHRKGLGITPTPKGIRRYRWHGWRVVGNLRPVSDRYTARTGDRVVRWRF